MFLFYRWSKEDSNNLYWYYQQCSSCEDPIEAIINMYENGGVHDKTKISVSFYIIYDEFKFYFISGAIL